MKKRLYSTWSRFYSVAGSGATAMTKMAQSVTTGLTKAWSWLRDSFAGSRTILWKVRSYAPIVTGLVFGLGLALFPAIFNTHYWTYMITVPLGIAGVFWVWMS